MADQVTAVAPEASVASRATGEFASLLYDELRALASRYMSHENSGHTLQPTALVHETFLRLAAQSGGWRNQAHFLAIAARTMRRVLLDHARRHDAVKRRGIRVTLSEWMPGAAEPPIDLLAVQEAVERLGALDERKARVVELRFFAGLEVEEVAQRLGVSAITVLRDWRFAKAWLGRELGEEAELRPALRDASW